MKKRLGIAIPLFFFFATIIAGFIYFDVKTYLSLSYLSSQQDVLTEFYLENKFIAIGLYLSIYTLLTAFSIPGSSIMTLTGGAVFGLILGTALASLASTIGATIAFLISRFIARDYIQNKFTKQVDIVNKCVEEDGGLCLFSARVIPAFPFFIVNLLMGLTSIRTFTFFWVSQLGMLPTTFVYVNAGTELGKLNSVSGILSPSLILSFVILGALPLGLKKIVQCFR